MLQTSQYIQVETIGRNSSKKHQVLVRFLTLRDKIVVFPLNGKPQDWLLNIRAKPEVKIFAVGGYSLGTARIKQISGLNDPLLQAFSRKYGSDAVNRWYRGQRTYVEFHLGNVGTIDISDLVYLDLETAFDGVADHYDQHIFGNPMNVWLRNVSVGLMMRHFTPGSVVLEIGCGTGTETLSLARHGVTVIAVDVSNRMLEILRGKAGMMGLSNRVIPVHCRPADISSRVHALRFDKLDGAYSTYGAINTEPRLAELISAVHGLLKDGAPFLVGVWNKYCLYEMLGYLIRLNPTMSFSRLRNPVPVGRSRFCVASNAFSVFTFF